LTKVLKILFILLNYLTVNYLSLMAVKNLVILGASGNVGKVVVPYLAKKGYHIKAVGRNKPNFDLENVENIGLDYDNQDDFNIVVAKSDATLVLVGFEYKAKVWQEKWPKFTKMLVEACSKAKSKVVFFDNVYGYGLVAGKMTEESKLNAETKKGLVRVEVQNILEEAQKKGEIKLVIAKSADFYGPNINTSVLGDRFFDFIQTKNTVEIFGNQEKKHNYTYVLDIAPALEKLISSDQEGVFHLPTNIAKTGEEFASILEKITHKNLKLTSLRQSTVFWLGFFIPILGELYEMMYQSENEYDFDSSKILKIFPDLKVTRYEEGFKTTLEYFEKMKKQS